MSSTPADTLPHWDMTTLYPSLDSPEFEAAFQALQRQIAELVTQFDARGVGAGVPGPADASQAASLAAVLGALNQVLDAAETMRAYLHALVSTDSRDNLAQSRQSELRPHLARLSQLETRFTAWVGAMDVEALIRASQLVADHAYALRRAQIAASHLMSPPEEVLATEMSLSGATAWARLQGDVSSQIVVTMEYEGRLQQLPMAVIRNLAYNPDREVRWRAHRAEMAAWERAAVPLAAALNGVKGQSELLARRRGWSSPLEASLFINSIDRETLDAMLSAARESFPTFRRYLRAKARAIGVERLAWYDLSAPLGESGRRWEFADARGFVLEQFGAYSERLQGLARRAFDERWIDAEPRNGKRGGAYCMWLRRGESRVFANYLPGLGGVTTLAHELGHAYHNLNLSERTPLQREVPMVLAETASIFCEHLVREAALQHADVPERLAILEDELQGAAAVVVDISSRFLFEEGVLSRRGKRELTVPELNDLMRQAQRETYGDAVDPATLHPYMWALKPHYYYPSLDFYNYPYMFGLLFGLGLYARYRAEPESFRPSFDELLSLAGMESATALAARFDIDIRTPAFWRSSLEVLAGDVARFEELVG